MDENRNHNNSNQHNISNANIDIARNNSKEDVQKCEYLIDSSKQCGKCPIDEKLFEVFNERICPECLAYDKRAAGHGSDYDLINKSVAKTKYLISEEMMSLIKFTTEKNPIKASWTPMKLCLRKHCKQIAIDKYGDEKTLEQEKKRRETIKYQKQYENVHQVIEINNKEMRSSLQENRMRLIPSEPSNPTMTIEETIAHNNYQKSVKAIKKSKYGKISFLNDVSNCFDTSK